MWDNHKTIQKVLKKCGHTTKNDVKFYLSVGIPQKRQKLR